MEENNEIRTGYRIGEFELCTTSEQFFKQGNRIAIEPQLFSLLHLLVTNRANIVSREQIERVVWAGRPATDESIRAAIKKLRDLLGDNARAPLFIKTIPKQGYKWLASVEKISASSLAQKQQRKVFKPVLIVLMIAVLVLLLWIFSPKHLPDAAPHNTIEQLTQLSGSEIFADYNKASQQLVFLHRESNISAQQLYIKDLMTNEIQRLSWDDKHYTDSFWSPDGKQLVFTSGFGPQVKHFVASFDENRSVTEVTPFEITANTQKYILGWQHNQSGLWLADEVTNPPPHSIYRFDFTTQDIEPVSLPNVTGRGDYYAAQSRNGKQIAILREVENNQSSLIIVDLTSNDVIANQLLPFTANRMVWLFDDSGVIISNFFGQAATFKLANNGFAFDIDLPPNAIDIYASCGERCVILRQHNGDYLDLKEVPQPKLTPMNESETPHLFNTRVLKKIGAQDLPQYVGEGKALVYASLEANQLALTLLNNSNQEQEIVAFDTPEGLSAITASFDGNRVAGVVDGRLFIVNDIHSIKTVHPPKFVSKALERLENPVWHEDSVHIYLAHYVGNSPAIIKLNTQTNERSRIIDGFVSFKKHSDNKNAIAIDPSLIAWHLTKQDGQWQKVSAFGQVHSANVHRWEYLGDVFYYTKLEQRVGLLCQRTIKPQTSVGEEQCTAIGKNMFRLNFDIQPNDSTVVMVESLSAQSDIIRLTW
ncbi:Transcriptional activator CadC [Pseudoalteromonas sp. P1-9]|uniref:winged helix-turn-helix domain-containing protein n=1 Tax=Pseudoalteromonas sp. P1-9 TaxID=1710354 RepID=UPI0006D5FBEE|nr:winged helix-turn-helix domain-containing protein [Pseudoalteromonas sp. P1-9]KPV95227.1 Transcriptional activator CadC [Pseudoalteromonas sp. P1-9]